MQPHGAGGENLVARFGNADGMFKLRRQRAVAGYRRPAIIQHFDRRFAQIDHRLDGKEHAGFQHRAGASGGSTAGNGGTSGAAGGAGGSQGNESRPAGEAANGAEQTQQGASALNFVASSSGDGANVQGGDAGGAEGGKRKSTSELNINNVTVPSSSGPLDVFVVDTGINLERVTKIRGLTN